jgi:archaellum component FlaF (FlaF/FlaG flagellin family)
LYRNNPDENSKQFKKKIMSKIDELLKRVGADFNLENKSVKATVTSNGSNIINIRIEVLKDNSAKIQTEKFEEYVNTLPDDLFMATLEVLGEDEVKRIDNCIHSEDLESVRSGIIKFKKALSKVIEAKLTELKSILPSCR